MATPTKSLARRLFGDSLLNAVTGLGTRRDSRTQSTYQATMMSTAMIAACYSGSGIMRKIVNIPALDMVREGRKWKTDSDAVTKIEAEEKRLLLWQRIRQAEVLRGLGGGALIMGLPGDLDTPAPEKIGPKGLRYLNPVWREHLTFTTIQSDPNLDGYGEPVMWKLATSNGGVDIHPSRVVPFRADLSAPVVGMMSADQYWGESKVAQCKDAVQDYDTARGALSSLIVKARTTRIGIPDLLNTLADEEGEKAFAGRMESLTSLESMFNTMVYDSGVNGGDAESIDDTTYNFAGFKDAMASFRTDVCAVADIPHTRLFGTAPEGMNSSGDSQQTDWNKLVSGRQTLEMAPCLAQIDPYLLQSSGASYDGDIWYDFNSLTQETKLQTAERFDKVMTAATKLQATMTIPDEAFARGMQSLMEDEGFIPGLEDALAMVPEAERFGITPTADPNADPNATPANENDVPGAPPAPPKRVGANDAEPRTLYVRRNLINAAEFIRWAKSQGFETTVPADEIHVTIARSRTSLDWMKIGDDWREDDKGNLTVSAGGARLVETLGDKGGVVLLFNSPALAYRHESITRAGASWDYPEYQPHLTITYKGTGVDLSKVVPFRGMLQFGPEIFEEFNDEWTGELVES